VSTKKYSCWTHIYFCTIIVNRNLVYYKLNTYADVLRVHITITICNFQIESSQLFSILSFIFCFITSNRFHFIYSYCIVCILFLVNYYYYFILWCMIIIIIIIIVRGKTWFYFHFFFFFNNNICIFRSSLRILRNFEMP